MIRHTPVVFTDDLPPRHQHGYFGQVELRKVASRYPREFVKELLDPRSNRLYFEWVKTAGLIRRGDDPFIKPDGLGAYELKLSERYEGALVAFPQPERMPEPYFAAIVLDNDSDPSVKYFRYITLNVVRSIDGEACTSLGEWTCEGSHLNYGPGPAPEADAFLEAVRSLLAIDGEESEWLIC